MALTESDDPKLANVLRSHVKQMSARLQSGRMIRGWDPAFREMVQHYDDIAHKVEATQKGLKITVSGKTPAAIKVAQNHADIVSNFAKNGWAEHDVRHPKVSEIKSDPDISKEATCSTCSKKSCCLVNDSKQNKEQEKLNISSKCQHCEKSTATSKNMHSH